MAERVFVQVDADQFDRRAKLTQPVAGIAELIWNALDTETVAVSIARTELSSGVPSSTPSSALDPALRIREGGALVGQLDWRAGAGRRTP